jgi:acyl carrier protein
MPNIQSEDVMSVIFEVFSPLEVSLDKSFDDLEANSVLLLRLMAALQRRFDVVLDVVDMFTVEDVGDLVRLVEERMPRKGFAPT